MPTLTQQTAADSWSVTAFRMAFQTCSDSAGVEESRLHQPPVQFTYQRPGGLRVSWLNNISIGTPWRGALR